MKTMLRTGSIIIIACSLCLFTVSTQAQETDAQKMLLDSIHKLDIAGVKAALDKGVNPNWGSATERKYSAIGILANGALGAHNKEKGEEKSVEILEMLFKSGAKLQPYDYMGVLSFPIIYGWAHFIEVLLKNGLDPTQEISGMTPMEIAADYGHSKIIELLRNYGVPTLGAQIAAQRRFINAALRHDIPVMEEAIRNGARVNDTNRQGQTALVTAVDSSLFDPDESLSILYLLNKGADPTIQDQTYYGSGKTTALHAAILRSSVIFEMEVKKTIKDDSPLYAKLILESLLRHGALVSARDSYGMTPLHIAARENNIVGARMLIEAGAKIMPKDDNGKTPLDYAESAEMIKLLKDHGAKEIP